MAPDIPYAWLLALGLARVSVVAYVSFVVFTRLALPDTASRSAWEGRAWGDAVLGVSTTLVVSFALGLLGVFDAASLAAVLALALACGAALRYRRLWRRTLLQRYARFLHWVERVAPPPPVVPGLGGAPPHPGPRAKVWVRRQVRSFGQTAPHAHWWIGLGVVAAVAVGVRLIPTLAEAAPFTLRYYASLETIKGLVAGDPVGTGSAWGMPALVMALSEMARVDAALVTRGVGALAAGAVAYGVYQTARFYWVGRVGAFAGALFIAAGGPLLPIPLARQAGAEPLMLAAALALPVFPHLAAYLGSGSRRGITVGGVGLLASGLIHPAVGALLAATLVVYVGSIVVQIRSREQSGEDLVRYRNRGVWRRVAVMGVTSAVVVTIWLGYTALLETVSAAGSIFFFEAGAAPAWGGRAGALAGVLGALVLAAAYAPDRSRYAESLPRPGALLRTGGQTLVMLLIWVLTGAQFAGLSGAAAVLLMSVVGVDVAFLVGELEARWRSRAAGAETRRLMWGPPLAALVVGGVVIGTGWSVPVPGAGVEPNGFVRGYHAVDRASLPYAWTAVSHLGTGVLARNRGRFLDYEYFLINFDPDTYDHGGPEAIPTADVYVFLERTPQDSRIVDELMPLGSNLAARTNAWVEQYSQRADQARYVSLFYQDDEVYVIRIGRTAPTLLDLADGSAAGAAPTPPTRP